MIRKNVPRFTFVTFTDSARLCCSFLVFSSTANAPPSLGTASEQPRHSLGTAYSTSMGYDARGHTPYGAPMGYMYTYDPPKNPYLGGHARDVSYEVRLTDNMVGIRAYMYV